MKSVFSDKIINCMENAVGMSLEDMRKSDVEKIHRTIEKKIGKTLKLKKESRHQGRGSMLIELDRWISREQIEKVFNKYFA